MKTNPASHLPLSHQAPAATLTATVRPQTQMLALLEKAATAGAWSLDLLAQDLQWTPHLATLMEMAPEGNSGFSHPLDFYAPESSELMAAAMQACVSQSTPFDQEVEVITARGRRHWVRSLGEAVVDASGAVVRIQGVLQDITEQHRTRQETLSLTMRLGTTLGSFKEAFATLDREGRFTFVNEEGERLLNRKSTELLQQVIWDTLDDTDSGRLRQEMLAALGSGQHLEFENFYATPGKWLELRAYPFDEGLAVYFRDVTERRKSHERQMLLQTSMSRLNDLVMITEAGSIDEPGPRLMFVNDAFEKYTGYSRGEVLGRSPRLLQGKRTQRSELDRIRAALEQAQPVRAELINYRKDGEPFWMELDIVPVDDFNRGLSHWVAVGRDVTARKLSEEELEHLAFYDTLTRLPNRPLLMNSLHTALYSATNSDTIGALMFIDLDNFKMLNDTRGHAVGDLLLQQVAARLNNCVRLRDTVARLGGDEFVVLLEDLGNDPEIAGQKARVIADKILAALGKPYKLAGLAYDGTCSIGITHFNQRQQSVGDLLKQADLAMYQAKASGRNAICFFDPGMQAQVTANAALTSELRHALREREFLLYYQPQVGTDDYMDGVEALVRWQHPKRGLLLPDAFIAQAEESGLILQLGQWVLETVCQQLGRWAERPETRHFSIAANVSARQFRHPQFVDYLMGVIKSTGVPAGKLKLELTESLLATDMEVTIAKMGTLKDAGVTLSIDDFGMGYSALSYLKHLPLDQIKIDRNFIKDILTDPNDAAIARTIIGLTQSLGLSVIAEGVETQPQRDFLARHGCRCFQGYLFCKPLPIDALELFIKTRPSAPVVDH